MYVSAVSLAARGDIIPLFSSRDKLELGNGHCCFTQPANPLRKKQEKVEEFELVEKLSYYTSHYKATFREQPDILSDVIGAAPSDGLIQRFIRHVEKPREMKDKHMKAYATRLPPRVGGGPKWGEVVHATATNEETVQMRPLKQLAAGLNLPPEFEVDPLAKNWHIFEELGKSPDPQVSATISCADD